MCSHGCCNNSTRRRPTRSPTILAKSLTVPPPAKSVSFKRWWPLAAVGLGGMLAVVVFWRPPTPGPSTQETGVAGITDSHSARSEEDQTGDPAPVERFDQLVVGIGPDADYATIAEGVLHAKPGATITVVGPGPYTDAVAIEGSDYDGLRIVASPRAVWKSPEFDNFRALGIRDVSDVHVQGFDFEVEQESGRAVQIEGDARDVTIDDCTFRHTLPQHAYSLAQVATAPGDDRSMVTIRDCRFEAAADPGRCLSLGAGQSAARVYCRGCFFSGQHNLVYVTDACRRVTLAHNVFFGGSVGLNASYKEWFPDSRLEVVNNTFVDTRYWFGLMDSFRSGSLPLRRGGIPDLQQSHPGWPSRAGWRGSMGARVRGLDVCLQLVGA